MATLTMNGSPDDTQEAKSPNVPSAIPLVVKNGILDCTRTAVGVVKNAVGSCLVAGVLALGSAPAMSDAPTVSIDQPSDSQDAQLLTELRSKGYSLEESQRIRQIMANSRRFSQELNLGTPLATVKFTPNSDKLADRLGVINENVSKLSTLKNKDIKDIIGVEKVTPENILQVLSTLHILNSAEANVMYEGDNVKAGARERTIARQGKNWIEKNIARIPADSLKQACDLANTLLSNLELATTETARLMVTTALDFYTPAPDYGPTPNEAQKITLANRPLNFAQSMSWVTALAKPGVSYRSDNQEIITVTVNDISYSFAPESRVRGIPGVPAALQGITTRAYAQLQTAQNITIANRTVIAKSEAVIADNKAVIAQKSVSIAQKEAVIADNKAVIADNKIESEKFKQSAAQKEQSAAQKEEHAFLIGTTESIRTRLLPLLAEYIGASPEKQKNIRNSIIPLAKQLREAEQITEKVQPLSEENKLAKEGSITRIKEMYVLLMKIDINLVKI